ncbi:P-loop containing nucleoside triphosphate hydrolase protein [Suillus lakei]|nr:P-loop containing nucleoside triphosphate hydrolase protein [Suillus lakei]
MVPRAPSNHEKDPRAKNVVIFGETGSGKSSVINVIAQKRLAKTSNDAPGCTSEPQSYSVEISGQKFALIDTAGLNEGTEGTVPPKQAIKQLKSLLRKHMKSRSPSDGVDLLVYCVRSATPRSALVYAHDTFYSRICQMKVPMVVVVTGLEEETPMEGWWNTDTTRQKFEGMQIAGHACVTTIQEYPGIPNELISRVAESSEILRDLVVKKYVVDDSFSAGAWCWSP